MASLRKSMKISPLRMIFRVKNGRFGKLWMVYPFKNERFLMAMLNLQLTGDSPPIIVFLWKLLSLQHKKLPAGPVAVQILGSRQRLTFVHHAVQNRKLPWGRHSRLAELKTVKALGIQTIEKAVARHISWASTAILAFMVPRL